jgi:hypothetical protein
LAGTDPGFQVRGAHLKKIVSNGGRHENCWGISCEKSRFYAKKSAPAWYLLILNKKELPVNSKVPVQLKNIESTKDLS